MLNSTHDDSVNTNTGLKCTSIDLLQLRTLWNNVINTTSSRIAYIYKMKKNLKDIMKKKLTAYELNLHKD